MKKFYILVKKEVKELLTPQMVLPLIAVVVVFMFIGKVVGKETAKTAGRQNIAVVDLDQSKMSENLMSGLKNSNFNVTKYAEGGANEAVQTAESQGAKNILVIPEGFEKSVEGLKPLPIQSFTVLQNFSFAGSRGLQSNAAAISVINQNVSGELLAKKAPDLPANLIKAPVTPQEFVMVGSQKTQGSPTAVMGFITQQTTFIPVILFLVIVFASQLIAVSIATEKENKTLETLLSSPVSRKTIVAAKLVGAGLVALLTSVIYLVGMRNYMSGFTGGAATDVDSATRAAVSELGLVLGTSDYILLGLSLFFGILAALSIALILGSFANDAKSAQGVITPLMVLILIPYFLTMLVDLSSASTSLKFLVYAIPFSHPFMAAPNLMLHHYKPVIYGILYMGVFFLAFVALAAKIFASDKILTMNLKFKKK